jgi:hypothetical protein
MFEALSAAVADGATEVTIASAIDATSAADIFFLNIENLL